MAGITRPAMKRAVYDLVCRKLKLEEDHRKADETAEERTWKNPNV
jgi:hypothetical protein